MSFRGQPNSKLIRPSNCAEFQRLEVPRTNPRWNSRGTNHIVSRALYNGSHIRSPSKIEERARQDSKWTSAWAVYWSSFSSLRRLDTLISLCGMYTALFYISIRPIQVYPSSRHALYLILSIIFAWIFIQPFSHCDRTTELSSLEQ